MTTIKQVAELSGVSRVTASAVINGKAGVSEKTRQKVLEACRELGYQPRRIERAQAARFSKMIGIIIRDYINPFYTQFVNAAAEVLRKQNYRVFTYDSGGDPEEEIVAAKMFFDHPAGGLILAPSTPEPEDHLSLFIDNDLPVVAISNVPGKNIHVIEFDDRWIGYLATKHLIDNGHRRIYHIAGPQSFPSARDRQVAFIQCMVEHDVPFNANSIIKTEGVLHDVSRAMPRLLRGRLKKTPCAFFCYSDFVAVAAYKTIREAGLRIPEDVSIIGCDDIEVACAMSPPLTTVALPTQEMGACAGRLILQALNGELPHSHLRETFQPKLIERESVANLKK